MKILPAILLLSLAALVFSCGQAQKNETMRIETGFVLKLDDALFQVMDTSAKAEIIGDGFEWSEGSLWVEKHKMLLFSDVPKNTVYKWTEKNGTEPYLSPSGYTGSAPSKSKEPGSNGLLLDNEGNLVLCQHGNRQMARMDAPLDKPEPVFTALATHYNGKRFSSPNDAVYNTNGELFFTDPPYGLPSQNDQDPGKELPFNGVYKLKKDGTVVLLVDSISRPNGLAFFPGEEQLLIANSEGRKAVWYIYDVEGDVLKNGRIWHDASNREKGWKGSPDGLKINKKGIVFATGPGGVCIFSSAGKKLGIIRLDHPASNCALSRDEQTLFITNDMYVLKVKLK